MKARTLRTAALLALAALLLTGCGKKNYKPLDTESFDREIRTNGAATEVYSGAEAPAGVAQNAISRIEFRNDEKGWEGTYCEFASAGEARDFFNSIIDSADPDSVHDPGGNYASFGFSGANGVYWKLEIVGNTFLGVGYQKDNTAAKKAVEKLLTALGY